MARGAGRVRQSFALRVATLLAALVLLVCGAGFGWGYLRVSGLLGAQLDAAIAATATSDKDVVARAFYEDMTTDARAKMSAITAPVTLLYPWDPTTPVPQATFDTLYTSAFATVPHVTVKRIDGSYHFIMIDQPAVFAHEVDAFLR